MASRQRSATGRFRLSKTAGPVADAPGSADISGTNRTARSGSASACRTGRTTAAGPSRLLNRSISSASGPSATPPGRRTASPAAAAAGSSGRPTDRDAVHRPRQCEPVAVQPDQFPQRLGQVGRPVQSDLDRRPTNSGRTAARTRTRIAPRPWACNSAVTRSISRSSTHSMSARRSVGYSNSSDASNTGGGRCGTRISGAAPMCLVEPQQQRLSEPRRRGRPAAAAAVRRSCRRRGGRADRSSRPAAASS